MGIEGHGILPGVRDSRARDFSLDVGFPVRGSFRRGVKRVLRFTNPIDVLVDELAHIVISIEIHRAICLRGAKMPGETHFSEALLPSCAEISGTSGCGRVRGLRRHPLFTEYGNSRDLR
jgi:hypothetical protein